MISPDKFHDECAVFGIYGHKEAANLAYLGLVELLYGYPLDGVVLTTGCDKTTPSAIMAASTISSAA